MIKKKHGEKTLFLAIRRSPRVLHMTAFGTRPGGPLSRQCLKTGQQKPALQQNCVLLIDVGIERKSG
jgi:hypothetical protein